MSQHDTTEIVRRDEDRPAPVQATAVAPQSLAAMEMHELIPRMELARRLPRSPEAFAVRLRKEAITNEPGSMVFRKPGKDDKGRPITLMGPSIRMTEIAARLFGNLDVGAPVTIYQESMVSVTVRVLDLETNVSECGVSTTSLVASSGRLMPPHVRANLALATAAKAFRNAVTKIIGKAMLDELVGPCLHAAEQRHQAEIDAEKKAGNSGDKWRRFVEGWAKVKITEAELLAACKVTTASEVTAAHFTSLAAAWTTATKEGIPPRVALGLEDEGTAPAATGSAVDGFFDQQEGGR